MKLISNACFCFCLTSVPPIVYKKAKQVADNKREDFIVKELEKILEKEGLSRKPDEKGENSSTKYLLAVYDINPKLTSTK